MKEQSHIIFKRKDKALVRSFQNRLKDDSVNLAYESQEMFEFFCLIQVWKISDLMLNHNKNKLILKEINHIQFPNLTKLKIHNNQIESIEGLSRVWMPMLQELYLDHNNISSLREFRKISFRNLNHILVDNNKVTEGEPLSQMKAAKTVKNIFLDYNKNERIVNDIGCVCKCESEEVHELWIINNLRISQFQVLKAIKGKYRKIQIRTKK